MAGWRWLKFLIEPDVHARYVAQTSYFPSTVSAIDTELRQGIYSENQIARRMIDEVSVYARILAPSLPTIPATAAYQDGSEGRITIVETTEVKLYMSIIANDFTCRSLQTTLHVDHCKRVVPT